MLLLLSVDVSQPIWAILSVGVTNHLVGVANLSVGVSNL